jgi:hypothetical protein
MKKLLLLIGVAALLATVLAPSASAIPSENLQTLAVPAVLAAGTTNFTAANAPYVDLVRSQAAPMFASTVSCASPGATNIYTFQPSTDGTLWDTNAVHSVLATNAVIGTGPVTWTAPIGTSGNYKAYRLISIATTGTATNGTHNVEQKIDAP